MYLRNVSPFALFWPAPLAPDHRVPQGGENQVFHTHALRVEQVVDDAGLVQVYDPAILASWPGQPFQGSPKLVRFSLPGRPFFFFSPSPPLALFLQRKDAMLANREKTQFWSFYLFFFMLLLFIVLFIVSANFSHLLFGENVWRNPFEGFGGRKISIFFRVRYRR